MFDILEIRSATQKCSIIFWTFQNLVYLNEIKINTLFINKNVCKLLFSTNYLEYYVINFFF